MSLDMASTTTPYSTRNKAEFTASALATLAIILAGAWVAVIWQPQRDDAAENGLRDFESRLQPGQSVDDARRILEEEGFAHLKWVSTFHPYFVVKTPPRAGAYNWVLWLEDRDGRIVGIRMREWRSRDRFPIQGPRETPAPANRVIPEASQWPKGLHYELVL